MYGVQGMMRDYAGYGMTADKAKELLAECMAGKHAELVRVGLPSSSESRGGHPVPKS